MENNVITISALNRYIKHIVTSDSHLKNITVVGEISNFKPHHTKHMYFTLKDDESRVDSVMFATNASKVEFPVNNGDKVVATGYIDVYPPTGKYQLYVVKLEPEGIGDLAKRFEMLKDKLSKEGLFDVSRKKSIPKYPKRIGVITATSGAAIRDIVSTIENRYKLAEVYIFRTIVQGENGTQSILNSLDLAEHYNLDTVIIGRGGGSIEDLWNFNEEEVVRRVANYSIPIISGVGHETDFTLCDFASDYRAETPTAAAVIATPNTEDVLIRFDNVDDKLKSILENKLSKYSNIVNKYDTMFFTNKLRYILQVNQTMFANEVRNIDLEISNKISKRKHELNLLISKDFAGMLQSKTRMLKHDLFKIDSALEVNIKSKLEKNRNKLNILSSKDFAGMLQSKTKTLRYELFKIDNALEVNIKKTIEKNKNEFIRNVTVLEQANPLKILSRGYSVSYSNDKIVKSVDDIKDNLKVVLSDGSVDIMINTKEVYKNE